MDNIIKISEQIKKVLDKHLIIDKFYSFVIKSYPHHFSLIITTTELKNKQFVELLKDLKYLEHDITNGLDSFIVNTSSDGEYIYFNGVLI